MILNIKIKANSNGEAYNIVSQLGFEHEVLEADLDGYNEKFSKINKPSYFLKDNKNIKANYKSKSDFDKLKIKIKK